MKTDSKIDNQAFPAPGTEFTHGYLGLTKRELFAAMAMQGICASEPSEKLDYEHTAHFAVEHADALIAELAKVRP